MDSKSVFEQKGGDIIYEAEKKYSNIQKKTKKNECTSILSMKSKIHYEMKLFFDHFIGQYQTKAHCPMCYQQFSSISTFFYLPLIIPQYSYHLKIKFFRFGNVYGKDSKVKEFYVSITPNVTTYELKRKVLSKRKSRRVLYSDNIELILFNKERNIERIIDNNDEYLFDLCNDEEYEICAYEKEENKDNIYCYITQYEATYHFFGLIPKYTMKYLIKYPISFPIENNENIDNIYSYVKTFIINNNTSLVENTFQSEKTKMLINNFLGISKENEKFCNFSIFFHSVIQNFDCCNFCGIYVGKNNNHFCQLINRFSSSNKYNTIRQSISNREIPLVLDIALSKAITLNYTPFFSEKNEKLFKISNYIDIYDCINTFTSGEIIEDNNLVQCKNCKAFQSFINKKKFSSLPLILMFHLQSEADKSPKFADFPLKNLEMNEYVSDGSKQKIIYDLYALSKKNEAGSFTTLCLYNDEWYQYNKFSLSKEIEEKEFIQNSEYILFYKKK